MLAFLSVCFVIPYCYVGLTHFFFDILLLVYLFCLLGIDKFRTIITQVFRDSRFTECDKFV